MAGKIRKNFTKGVINLILTPEQQALLDGSRGETMAKVMKVMEDGVVEVE